MHASVAHGESHATRGHRAFQREALAACEGESEATHPESARQLIFHDREDCLRNAMARTILMAMILATASTMLAAEGRPSLFLVDGTFQGQWTLILQVDPDTGALQLRADLGNTNTPMLGMAAASKTTLYLTGTDRGPDNLCQGDIACLLIRVDLDPLSTTPSLVQTIGT